MTEPFYVLDSSGAVVFSAAFTASDELIVSGSGALLNAFDVKRLGDWIEAWLGEEVA